jgi:hypothetical protein
MTQSHVDVRTGRAIGSYPTYAEAQRVVDRLSDEKFPVEHVSIVGKDLRLVEKVVGRMTVGRAALAGLATGAWFGAVVGLVFWIVSPWALGAVVAAVLIGALFGAIWGAVAHLLTRGERDFASVSGLDAAAYEVIVDESHFADALRLLEPASPAPGTRPTSDTG